MMAWLTMGLSTTHGNQNRLYRIANITELLLEVSGIIHYNSNSPPMKKVSWGSQLCWPSIEHASLLKSVWSNATVALGQTFRFNISQMDLMDSRD